MNKRIIGRRIFVIFISFHSLIFGTKGVGDILSFPVINFLCLGGFIARGQGMSFVFSYLTDQIFNFSLSILSTVLNRWYVFFSGSHRRPLKLNRRGVCRTHPETFLILV